VLGAIPEALTDRMLTREEIAQEVGRIVGSEELGGTEEAAREVTRRYLAAYGPATREEFVRWFGTSSPAQAGRLIEGLLGQEIASVEIEGSRAWMLAEQLPEVEAAEPSEEVQSVAVSMILAVKQSGWPSASRWASWRWRERC
jgi:Winged helix DNA-binding domain